jgi:bifunctional non-homologous end joining protein LigD
MPSPESFPHTLEPMLAQATRSGAPLPEGEEWAYEIKWDGIRALYYAEGGTARMTNRKGEQITGRYPELEPLAAALGEHSAVLDGEVVALDDAGRPSFQLIQRRMTLTDPGRVKQRMVDTPVRYIAFDVLHLDGKSTRELPYTERRALLDSLGLDGETWATPRSHDGPGSHLLEAARQQGLEGVVAKRRDSPYRPGKRTGEWVKLRIWQQQEFVIGGWLPGEGSRSGRVGSVLVGHYDGDRLLYAGGVGSGLKQADIDFLTNELKARERPESPFAVGGPTGARGRQARWAEPELVCEVSWSEWTQEGTLRQPAFKGMRTDKDPRNVVRET